MTVDPDIWHLRVPDASADCFMTRLRNSRQERIVVDSVSSQTPSMIVERVTIFAIQTEDIFSFRQRMIAQQPRMFLIEHFNCLTLFHSHFYF